MSKRLKRYRHDKYKKYSDLIDILLVAESEDEIVMKNHVARPTGSSAPPEANAVLHKTRKPIFKKR